MASKIQKILFSLQDQEYADFQRGLIPGLKAEKIIGVRVPALRDLAREMRKNAATAEFIVELPHEYFDEYQLHSFIIAEIKDFDLLIKELERFLPYVDNWAVCDSLSPKIFKKEKGKLIGYIKKWLGSNHEYTVRFAVLMLMKHYLDEDFSPAYAEAVAGLNDQDYYVHMMIAWYFATALAKRYDEILPFLEKRVLSRKTHNKTIEKAIESRRISAEQKAYLLGLKWK